MPAWVELAVFIVATAMVLLGAVGVITRTNPVHAALALVLTLFGIAVHFAALEAHFLAAVQIIVYAGAIVILFLFVIMLLGVDKAEDLTTEPLVGQRAMGALVAVGVGGLVGAAVIISRSVIGQDPPQIADDDNIRALGAAIFGDYVFAFELTSVLLVVAVVGTVVLARKLPKKEGA